MPEQTGRSADATTLMEPLTVRIQEACRITGIGRSKLYELMEAGDIATLKVGGIRLIPVESLKAFLAAKREA